MKRILYILSFFIFYFKDVILSTFRIGIDVMTPGLKINPCIKRIDTKKYSHYLTLFFANLISFTPGTLTIKYQSKGNFLLVHFLYRDEVENFYENFIQRFDKAFHHKRDKI